MKLGVFLAIGESFSDFALKGQDDLIIRQNLSRYAEVFEEVIVFSYGNENFRPLRNVVVLPNKWHMHRYLYALCMPFIYRSQINTCQVFRGLQLSGGIPGMIVRLFGKPVVINYGYVYSDFAYKEGKPIRGLLYKFFEPIILQCMTTIIVTTKKLQRKLSPWWYRKVVYIPNGVDTQLFRPDARIHNKQFTVIFVGRLEPIKNLSSIIHAVSKLSFKLQLLFIGSGSEKQQLLTLAQRLGVLLLIRDALPNKKIAYFLRRSSMFILPSFAEGHPKALLEAMSCGLPVVGTRVSGIEELINDGENGLLCETNPQSIAAAIAKIYRGHRLARKLGNNARRTILRKFTLAKTLYEENVILKKVSKAVLT